MALGEGRCFQWNRQRLGTDSMKCQVRVGIWSGVQEVAVRKIQFDKIINEH
jgi:hypothetical protein